MSRSTSIPDDMRTGGRRAARLVAARLQELGRPADLLTDEALATLCEAAQGSPARLHALLASALFLASTEDAGAIEADHVRRAALSLGGEGPAPAPARRRWGLAAAVGAGVCVLAALAVLLPGFRHGQVPRPAQPPVPGFNAVPVPAPLPRPVPAIIPSKPVRAAKPPPPPPVQAAPPAPAAPAPPPVALPEAPPAIVIIRYKKGDKAAEARAHAVASRLASAQVTTRLQAQAHLKRAVVGFFYQEDRGLALRVAAAAGLPAPARENPFDAATLPYPGTIEVALP